MSITRFTPSDLGPALNPNDNVAAVAQDAFYKARENARQDAEAGRQAERFPMEKEQFAMKQETHQADMEDRAWSNENIRPFEVQQKELGLMSSKLGIANQSLNYQQTNQKMQLDAMRMGQEMQTNQMLDSTLGWMKGQSQGDGGLAAKLPAPMQGMAGDFEEAGRQYGLDPTFLAAVSAHETGNGTSPAFRQKNNAMGVSSDTGPIAFGSTRESIFRQAKTLAGGTYKGADDISSIGAVYAPPGAGNDPHNDNPSWASGVSKYMTQFGGTADGSVRRSSSLNGGTGVPSLTQTVSGSTPTGMPVVAAAAGSLNPGAVIAQSFAPEQRQALAQYDALGVVAQTGQPYQQAKAVMMMRTMESDPRFTAAKTQQDEMVKSVQNQVHANSIMKSSPDDQREAFNSRFASSYNIKRTEDGQLMPFNSHTDLPLTTREYPAFADSYVKFGDTYKYDPMAARAEDKIYAESKPKFSAIEAFKNVQEPERPDPKEYGVTFDAKGHPVDLSDNKLYAQALKNYDVQKRAYDTQKNTVDIYRNELVIDSFSNKKVKAMYDTLYPRPKEIEGPPAPEATEAPAPPKKDIAVAANLPEAQEAERLKQENLPKWDAAKADFQKNVVAHFPDTGKDDAALNPVIQAAAKIHQAVAADNDLLKKVLPNGLVAGNVAFRDTSRWGPDEVDYGEVAKAWAEDILRKYGYLEDPSKKAAPAAAPAGAKKTASGNTFKPAA